MAAAAVRPQRFAWLQLILGSDDTSTAAAGSAARTALGDDAVGGSALPNCPASDTALGGVLYHPTVVFTYALIALTCFGIAAYTLAKFNSVTVFNRKIRTPSISNTPWIIFYVLSGLSCVRYGLNTVATPDDILDVVLLLAALALDGFALLALALALQHQRLHRSGNHYVPLPGSINGGNSINKPGPVDLGSSRLQTIKRALFSTAALLWLLVVAYDAFLALDVALGDEIFFFLFASSYGLLRLPVIVLTLLIYATKTFSDGPSVAARRWLALATLLNLAMTLPPTVWADVLPDACSLYFASIADLLQWLYLGSLVVYFVFVRAEYKRNMEETIWTTVSQIQDTFDFRRF